MSKSGPISVPSGGGALHGLGETFSPDLFTGTGNISLPLSVPAGRNGLQPDLNLTYSSGHGNGFYGMGWALALPSISRKSSNGVPVYDDTRDTFVYGSVDDLVPAGGIAARRRYRPRSESLFARIEHVRTATTNHWEARTKDGLRSIYGTPDAAGADPAVVADPADAINVLTWALTRTEDLFGNRIEYSYGHGPTQADGPRRWDQLYPQAIRYSDHGALDDRRFLISVEFVYADRPDPFSSYRAGFEVRTTQRCERIELHTHAGVDRHAGSFHLRYADQVPLPRVAANGVSQLAELQMEGIAGAATESMPPMVFGYSQFDADGRDLLPVSGPDLPALSLAQPNLELVDLFGAGLPDLVSLARDDVRYWRNLGNGQFDWSQQMRDAPGGLALSDRGVQLVDANGDGRQDLMVTIGTTTGYFPLTFKAGWDRAGFQRTELAPTFDLEDPEVKLIDLDGNGVVDALRSSVRFECFFNDPLRGWYDARFVERRQLDDFPNVTFADERVRVADMSGDGLQDVVFIHDRRVEYWPNLGFGDWARRITMRNSPALPFDYDPKRLLLGDLDGDGLADLAYVEDRQVTIWINQSGNSWGEPHVVKGTPPVTNVDGARLVDLLGTGTDGILWSGLYDDLARSSMFFLDLTGSTKPYLLTDIANQLGARTSVEYSSSTSYYLVHQQRHATRWTTTLPFPVQVVARVQTEDLVTGDVATTRFDYHHGYWDGIDREFRGFARVDRFDADTTDAAPPLETRRWFHVGPVADRIDDWHELDHHAEHWAEDPNLLTRPPAITTMLAGLPRSVRREALRAQRGQTRRVEVYARDGDARAGRPYTVTESVCGVREEPADTPCFFAFKLGERTTQWDRGDEPMMRFAFMEPPDAYGQARRHLDVAVPRGRDPLSAMAVAAEPYLATVAQTEWAVRDDATHYVLNRVTRSRNHEVRNNGTSTAFELRDAVFSDTAAVELLNQVVNFYDGDAFVGLPFGQLGDHGVVSRTEELVLTPQRLQEAWPAVPPYLAAGAPAWTADYPVAYRAGLPAGAGYVYHPADGTYAEGWYSMTCRRRYDFQSGASARGSVLVERTPLGHDTTITYDAYGLYPVRVTNAAGMTTTASYDYRVLQVDETTDVNGNRTRFQFSPLGRVRSQVRMGKPGENVGDTPTRPTLSWEYDDFAFAAAGRPTSVRANHRVHHVHDADVPAAERDGTVETRTYYDGFGRAVQTRRLGDDRLFGDLVRGDAGLPIDQTDPVGPASGVDGEWVVVSEWKRYDNKGRVVESFEPFFDTSWDYAEPTAAQRGLSTRTLYDARGQVIRTRRADGAEARVVYGVPTSLDDPDHFTPTPWEGYFYDPNDNAGRTHPAASTSYQHHWDTPRSQTIDALARVVSVVQRPSISAGDWITAHSTYDAQGRLLTVTDASGRLVARQVYDQNGRVLRSEQLDAGLRRTMYDAGGGPIEHRDAKGALVLTAYDVLHRKVGTWARDRTGAPVTRRTELVYGDMPGSGLSAAQAASANVLDVLVRQYDEAGLATIVAHDFKGNPLEKQRRLFRDDVFAATVASAVGWSIPAFAVDWDRADAESLLETTVYRTSSTFDALGRVKAGRYPADDGGTRHVLRPRYHRGGGLQSLSVDGRVLLPWVAHDAYGHRAVTTYANGWMTRLAHDPFTRGLRRVRTERYTETAPGTFQPTGAPLQDIGYVKDLAGNTLEQRDRTPGSGLAATPLGADALDRLFEYDATYRLVAATGREADTAPARPWDPAPRSDDPNATRAYTETYEYDLAGNLTELRHQAGAGATTRTYALDPTSNRLASVTTGASITSYTYDVAGNLTSETTSRHFEWNHADRLSSFRTQTPGAEPSLYTWYAYDAGGARVKKLTRHQGGHLESTVTLDGVFTVRRWGSGPQQRNCRLDVNEQGTRLASWRFGPAEPGDPSPALVFQFRDPLGNVAFTADDSGGWITREEFTPFGETSFGGFARKRYRFAGKERDEESGLDYVGMRYYAPWLARWTSTDPAGMASGFNLYTYVHDNPVNHTDPSGLQEAPAGAPEQPEGGVAVSDPEKERQADAGAPPPASSDLGSGVHFETEESAKETQATLIPGGAAPPEAATRGQQPMESNKHQNAWAKKETVTGIKKGAKDFAIDMAQATLTPALVIRPKKTSELMQYLESLRTECDTELCANVGAATQYSLHAATLGAGEALSALDEARALEALITASEDVKVASAAGGALPPAAPAVVQAEEHVTVFRYYSADNPVALRPKVSMQPAKQAQVMDQINASPAFKEALADLHMKGYPGIMADSPFVSVGDNPLKIAMSPDPWLKKIATGSSWGRNLPNAARATDLGIFRVPKSRLVFPRAENALSIKEGEILFVGDDLEQFLVYSWPNPY